jgi:hypothetical protein
MRQSAEVRFWNKVHKTATCWLWRGHKNKGYGLFAEDGLKARKRVHRFSWELHNGAIPGGLLVCHKCDVRCCVRPDHLFLGTHQDNYDDMVSKGRQRTRQRETEERIQTAGIDGTEVIRWHSLKLEAR